jgi:hypothetical protein
MGPKTQGTYLVEVLDQAHSRQIRTLRARVRASWGLSGWCPLERYRSPEARARDKPTVSPSGRSFATSTRANH